MKRSVIIIFCFLLLAVVSQACLAETPDPLYQEIINAAAAVLRGEGSGRFTAGEDFSCMFETAARFGSADGMGYTLIDLDNDGIAELLFGENYPGAADTVLYDLYTIRNGEVVHVFDGWDRSRYYLGANGEILYQGSSSAFTSYDGSFLYSEGGLILLYSLIFNTEADSSAPWFLSSAGLYDVNGARHLSEKEAQAIIAHLIPQFISLTPFN